MTGKNPGKHGIYDFTERVPGSFDIQLVNSRHRRCRTVWRILSDAGKPVGVVGVPVCYPPEVINGVMISGFDTPVAMADEKVMYPPELCEELKRAIGGILSLPTSFPLFPREGSKRRRPRLSRLSREKPRPPNISFVASLGTAL